MGSAALVTTPPLHEALWGNLRTLLRGLLLAVGLASPGAEAAGSSDAELVEQARQGGPRGQEAYRTLVLRYQSWVLRFVTYLMGGREADAEDVTQEVFVRAYLALESYRGDASFTAWLRTIAMRTTFNYKRSAQNARKYEDRAAAQAQVLESPAPPSERALLAKEEVERVLSGLSWPYREILVLRYVEELDVEEIAEVLGIGLSAAKMRLKRARDAFRERAGGTPGHGE